jgi:hypothetical protein
MRHAVIAEMVQATAESSPQESDGETAGTSGWCVQANENKTSYNAMPWWQRLELDVLLAKRRMRRPAAQKGGTTKLKAGARALFGGPAAGKLRSAARPPGVRA